MRPCMVGRTSKLNNMSKRTFQILDEMNVADEENKTITCIACPDLIGAKTHPMGIEVAMGVPAEIGHKLMFEPQRYKPILLVIDMHEFDKRAEK